MLLKNNRNIICYLSKFSYNNVFNPIFEKDGSNINKRILSEIEKYKLNQETNNTGEKQ